MTDVQAALGLFDREVKKLLENLPPCPPLADHGAVLAHNRKLCRLQQLIEYHVRKLPPYAFAPHLLAIGTELVHRTEYSTAETACYERLAQLNLPTVEHVNKLAELDKLALHCQALCGIQSCQGNKLLLQDPQITHTNTLKTLLEALAGLQAACMTVVQKQQLYWLVQNVTVHIYKLAEPLVTAGFYMEALPYLVFAAKAMEAHLQLSSTRFLAWRLHLYYTAAHCYCAGSKVASDSGSSNKDIGISMQQAHAFLDDGLAQLDSIVKAQALDPVPPPAAFAAALHAACSQLLLLKAMLEPLPGQPPSSAAAICDTLTAVGPDSMQLKALLGVLVAGPGSSTQPLQQLTLPQHLQPVLAAAVDLVKPMLTTQQTPIGAGSPGTGTDASPHIPDDLHVSFLCIAYKYQQQDLLQQLVAAAQAEVLSATRTNGQASNCLQAAAAVLPAVQQVQQAAGDASMLQLATALQQHCRALGQCLPGLLAAAAMVLHKAAGPLLLGNFSVLDQTMRPYQQVLDGLHEALQCSGCDDGVLRGSVGIRLAVVLEQQHELNRARQVVQQALSAILAARSDLLRHLDGAPDEHFRWISGSRTQANSVTALLVAGMLPSEQDLACLHADALLVQQRLELAVGLREAASRAKVKQDQLLTTAAKRDKQADIFGARTIKDRRADDAAAEAAGKAPASSAVHERQLLEACGKNPYQRALLLTQIAAYQPDTTRQIAALKEACTLLQAAQSSEADIFNAQQPPTAVKSSDPPHSRPLQPKVLRRTPNSITLTYWHVHLRGHTPAVRFAAYCKPTGAGVALTINPTAMEYPGSGVQVPLGSQVTIEGLQSNETYTFAVAAYDDEGQLVGELGVQSPPVLMALPLPLYSCWAHILLTAACLRHWTIVKEAASVLMPRFISISPARQLWQAHPMDLLQLQLPEVQAAAGPLLRLLVQAVYVYADHVRHLQHKQVLGHQVAGAAVAAASKSGLAGTAASRVMLLQLSESQVPAQVAMLEASKRLIAAMQVAAIIGDEMLVEEGALRAYNLLAPLLQQRDVSPLLHQPLAALHLALAAVKDTAPASLFGHLNQRQMAARATAAVSYWLMRLSAPISPGLMSAAVAGSLAGVVGRQLQPAAAFARLDAALLRVLSTQTGTAAGGAAAASASAASAARASPWPGNPAAKSTRRNTAHDSQAAAAAAAGPSGAMNIKAAATSERQQVELAAAQEFVLCHPDGPAWASPAVASRLSDASDLVAQVLPKLCRPDPLATCWPLLAPDAARTHPRWLPLCVMLLEAAAKQHGALLVLAIQPNQDPGVLAGQGVGVGLTTFPAGLQATASPRLLAAAATAAEVVAAVQQHVRLAARVPQFVDWAREPKWNAAAASSALTAGGSGSEASRAAPPPPGVATDQEAQQLAAVLLLQQRLPVLLQRRRSILATRKQLASWAPWLAHMHTLLGGMAAEAAASISVQILQPPASGAVTARRTRSTPVSPEGPGVPGADTSSRPGSSRDSRPASPDRAAAAAADSRPTSARGTAASSEESDGSSRPSSARAGNTTPRGAAGGATCKTPRAGMHIGAAPQQQMSQDRIAQKLAAQALQQLAQAAVLALRAGPSSWQQLLNSTKQLWNVSRQLLNRYPSLTLPVPPVAWAHSLLPDPRVPALVAEAPARSSSPDKGADAGGAKGKAAAKGPVKPSSAKAAGDKKAAAAGAKDGKGALAAVPEAPTRHILLPQTRGQNAATAFRAVVEALLVMLHQLRSGEKYHPGVIPVHQPVDCSCSSATVKSRCKQGNTTGTVLQLMSTVKSTTEPDTARSATTGLEGAPTEFSCGSDAVTADWHKGGPVDVPSLTRLVLLVLRVLHGMERWGTMLSLGRQWLDTCGGSAAAALLPLVLTAAVKVDNSAEVAALMTASQAVERDKHAAFDALDKVRWLVVERLGDLPLLDQQSTNKPNNGPAAAPSGSTTSRSLATSRRVPCLGLLGDMTSWSVKSATGAAAGPDYVILPAQYVKAIELLKKRGEKAHMILALHELGDLWAHFGHWQQAGQAWNSALDALLGPYQVISTWTHALELGTWQQLLGRYGVHGLLLTGLLLGKLARYIYFGDLNSRLSCARLAAELLPAVFACDIIHPQRPLDCASYVPLEIWPGADVFDDPYRCNALDLLSGLETLCGILLKQQLCLPFLPLLSLWEHTALQQAGSKVSVLLARITRVQTLARLGLPAEAAAVLHGVMQGQNLPGLMLQAPQPILGPDGIGLGLFDTANMPADSKAGSAAAAAGEAARPLMYSNSNWPGHPSNAAVIEYFSNAVLHPSVAEAYGPWLCGQIVLARAAWLAAVGGVPNCWRSMDPAAAAAACMGSAAAGSAAVDPGSTGRQTNIAPAAAAAGKAGTAATTATANAPEVEGRLLDNAAKLLQSMVSTSRKAVGMMALQGCSWDQDGQQPGEPAGHTGTATSKGGKAGDKGISKAGKKGGTKATGKAASKQGSEPAAAAASAGTGAGPDSSEQGGKEGQERLLAQHQQLLVAGLMQLAEVEAFRWHTTQALRASMAVSSIFAGIKAGDGAAGMQSQACGSPSEVAPVMWHGGDGGSTSNADDLERVTLQPGTWLAARWQLARLLLQLQHYTACVGLCTRALSDAKSAGDELWMVKLQHVQATAWAAQGDEAAALTVLRDALARLLGLALHDSVLVSLQLDYALLCEQVGARAEADRLAKAALATSNSLVEQHGLHEMREYPELLSIYMPSVATHLAVLMLAARCAMRRHQLATAEKQLRQAAALLGNTRSLPTTHVQVALHLAQVLRLQAALKLPATDAVVSGPTPQAAVNSQRPTSQNDSSKPAATESIEQQGDDHNAAQGAEAANADADSQNAAGTKQGTASAAAEGAETPKLPGLQLQQHRLQEAVQLLLHALRLLVSDGGSHVMLVRNTLLELAANWLYSHQLRANKTLTAATQQAGAGQSAAASRDTGNGSAGPAQIMAALHAAHVTAGHLRTLYLTPHQLQPVHDPETSLPLWLVEWLKGQEQLQSSMQQRSAAEAAAAAARAGKPAGGVAKRLHQPQLGKEAADIQVTGSVLARMAVCYYVQQLSGIAGELPGLEQQLLAAARALQVQAALKAACPKFNTDCSWSEVPAVTAGASEAALPVGAVCIQWYRQECCWQVPTSWRNTGSLPPSGQPIKTDALHALPPTSQHPTCLFVIHIPAQTTALAGSGIAATGFGTTTAAVGSQTQQLPAGQLAVGEVVVESLETLKRVQWQVKAMRRRLEHPGKLTDVFAQGPPSNKELSAAKHTIECFLAGIHEANMPPPPADLPETETQAAAVTLAATATATTAAAGSGKSAAAAAAAGKTGGTAAAGAGVAKASVAGNAAAQLQQTMAAIGARSGSCELHQVMDWRNVSTWIKMEALLDVEDGFVGKDAALAAWLSPLVAKYRAHSA